MYRNEDRQAYSTTGWMINTDSSPKLVDVLTDEGASRGELIVPPYSQTHTTFLNL